jgi:putative transposase
VLTEASGIPIGLAVDGANRHDMKLVEPTLQAQVVDRPEPTKEHPQHLCLDAGYDYDAVRDVLDAWGYTAHIRSRDEEKTEKARIPGYRARRWVVERTPSWLNRFRRILIRWEKKVENYLAMLHFACAWITKNLAGCPTARCGEESEQPEGLIEFRHDTQSKRSCCIRPEIPLCVGTQISQTDSGRGGCASCT